MYICTSCKNTFEEPSETSNTVPYGSQFVKESASLSCPYCSGDITEAKECELCGNFCESKSNSATVCDDCVNDLKKRFNELISKTFNETELSILSEIFDEGELFDT